MSKEYFAHTIEEKNLESCLENQFANSKIISHTIILLFTTKKLSDIHKKQTLKKI